MPRTTQRPATAPRRWPALSHGIRGRLHERLEHWDEDRSVAALPDEAILAREQVRQVERALLGLSDKLRAVVVLYYSAELSYAEIAEVLGIKVGTVKSRLSTALVQLRERMEAAR